MQGEVTSIVLDEVLQPKFESNRGTKWDSFHFSTTKERVILGTVVVDLGDDDKIPVDELIINSSFALLIPKDGPKPLAFRDVVDILH